jgi:hypothetical protein
MIHLLSEEGFIDGQLADGHLGEFARPTRRLHRLSALGHARRGRWTTEHRIMGRVHTALVVAVRSTMGGDEGALMIDLHGLPCPPLHLHALPHIGRGHRVAVGFDRD